MKNKLTSAIIKSRLYLKMIYVLKKIKLKRHNKLNLYDVIKVFIENITKDEIIERANAVAFNFALAMFPAVIFLFTLTPYIHELIPEVSRESIMKFIENLMPKAMYDTIEPTVLDIISRTRGGLLTFGAIFSLFLSTNGMVSLMNAFNSVYKTSDNNRGFIKTRIIATGLTFMLAFGLILAVLLLVIGNFTLDFLLSIEWLYIQDYHVVLFLLLRFLVIFIVFFLAVSSMYYFGPAVHYNWHFFSIGSFLATVLCIMVSYGFSYYVSNFSNYNKLYGSLGFLIALMIWQELLSIVLLVGYEINASIHKAYYLTTLKKEEKK